MKSPTAAAKSRKAPESPSDGDSTMIVTKGSVSFFGATGSGAKDIAPLIEFLGNDRIKVTALVETESGETQPVAIWIKCNVNSKTGEVFVGAFGFDSRSKEHIAASAENTVLRAAMASMTQRLSALESATS